MERRGLRLGLGILGCATVALSLWPARSDDPPPPAFSAGPALSADTSPKPDPAPAEADALCASRPLRLPNGAPPRLSCRDARAIVRDVHSRFAVETEGPKLELFAELLVGWLDPHGLWSAAPDAPARHLLREAANELLAELRAPSNGASCTAAEHAGVELERWVSELASIYDLGIHEKAVRSRQRAHAHAIEPIFEDDPVTMPARVLARSLGERLARFELAFPLPGAGLAAEARNRYFPALPREGWSEAVLSAAVRAYVAALDPHGAWTPLDEEWSLYADEPGFDTGSFLWGRITRSAAGVRVVEGPVEPLAVGDLVLAIDGVRTAGMPLEQVEQLARVEPSDGGLRRALIVRPHETTARELVIHATARDDPSERLPPLETERVRYGDGYTLAVALPNVADGVEEALAELLDESATHEISGILLDLRGNGGGSTDAALGVIGLFLPNEPLFPLSSHGHVVEVMRAPPPHDARPWKGAVAALVDGHTASAAEMIAGALGAYGRGPVVGSPTFGKGCIQEYTDDPTGNGVLRLTSLLFALPDGSALQGVGLTPSLLLSLPKAPAREATVPGSLPSYTGPDVRPSGRLPARPWPRHRQRVGPCRDPVVCAALSRLGEPERRSASRTRRARR